jgi:hypothetical protein
MRVQLVERVLPGAEELQLVDIVEDDVDPVALPEQEGVGVGAAEINQKLGSKCHMPGSTVFSETPLNSAFLI